MIDSKSGFMQGQPDSKYLSPIEDDSETFLSHIYWPKVEP